jgi:hypothetical protein
MLPYNSLKIPLATSRYRATDAEHLSRVAQ